MPLILEFLTHIKWKVIFIIIRSALRFGLARQPTNTLITSELCGPILSDILILVWNCLDSKNKGVTFKLKNWCRINLSSRLYIKHQLINWHPQVTQSVAINKKEKLFTDSLVLLSRYYQ